MDKKHIFVIKNQYLGLEELEKALKEVVIEITGNDSYDGKYLESINKFGLYKLCECNSEQDFNNTMNLIEKYKIVTIDFNEEDFNLLQIYYETIKDNLEKHTAVLDGVRYEPKWALDSQHYYTLYFDDEINDKNIKLLNEYLNQQDSWFIHSKESVKKAMDNRYLKIKNSNNLKELVNLRNKLKFKTSIYFWKKDGPIYYLIFDEPITKSNLKKLNDFVERYHNHVFSLEEAKQWKKNKGYLSFANSKIYEDLQELAKALNFKTKIIMADYKKDTDTLFDRILTEKTEVIKKN